MRRLQRTDFPAAAPGSTQALAAGIEKPGAGLLRGGIRPAGPVDASFALDPMYACKIRTTWKTARRMVEEENGKHGTPQDCKDWVVSLPNDMTSR